MGALPTRTLMVLSGEITRLNRISSWIFFCYLFVLGFFYAVLWSFYSIGSAIMLDESNARVSEEILCIIRRRSNWWGNCITNSVACLTCTRQLAFMGKYKWTEDQCVSGVKVIC